MHSTVGSSIREAMPPKEHGSSHRINPRVDSRLCEVNPHHECRFQSGSLTKSLFGVGPSSSGSVLRDRNTAVADIRACHNPNPPNDEERDGSEDRRLLIVGPMC